jgi:hypothetical protein
LKITALLVIFWNVFIHSHREWAVKCRKDTCLDRRNFWNRTIITIIQKIQYFSILIWLKLLRVPIWWYSLFDSSQNVSHIYKQLLSSNFVRNWCTNTHTHVSKILSSSIINWLWIKVKFGYHGYHSKTGNVSSGWFGL